MARLDYPRAWPTLFVDLLGRLQSAVEAGPAGTLAVRRSYLALHHTLKELASKRLAADQRAFEEVTAQLLEPLWKQWEADTAALTSGLPTALRAGSDPSSQQVPLLTFERWLLQLKSLRRLLLFGFPSDARTMDQVPAVAQVVPAMLATLQALLALTPTAATGAARSQLAAMLDRGSIKLLKTLRQLQELHPWSVLHSGALLSMLDMACAQIGTPSMRLGTVADQFMKQCLLLISGVVKCASYKGSAAALSVSAGKGREQMQRLKEMAAQATPTLHAFWATKEEALVQIIVTRLFPLSSKELEMWDDSGEELHQELDHSGQDESVRGCAEQAYAALLEADRARLGPAVVDMLRRAGEGSLLPANGHSHVQGVPVAVLAKAAVYHAVAVGAYELHDFLDFSSWLHASLLVEICDASTAARPLRRSAIKVVAYWAPRLKKEDRPAVYRALVSALADHDAAIHLAAAATLHALLEDWEFDPDQFAEFVPLVFQLLARLLQSSVEYEAQLEAFALINLIIDRLGGTVASYAGGLLQLLPAVWSASEGQSLLRIQVLLALQRVVHALGVDSPNSYPVLLPVLAVATDPSQPDELNLMEDGLLLWLVALRHAPAPHPGLLAPLGHLLNAMERSTEHVAVGTRLISSCVLLGGGEVLAAHGQGIVSVLTGYVGNVKDRGMLCLLPVMDLIVQLFPQDGPALLRPALVALIRLLLSGQEPATVVAHGLGLLARVLVQNPQAFLQLFQAAGAQLGAALPPPGQGEDPDPTSRLLLAVLDLWLEKFDSIGQAAARKLSALALCMLLTLPVPQVLLRCEAIAAHVTAVWFELEGPDAGAGAAFGLDFYSAGTGPKDDDIPVAVDLEEAEGEMGRRRALFERNAVPTLNLSAFCKQQMEAAAGVHGGALNEALNALDPALGKQLSDMLAVAN